DSSELAARRIVSDWDDCVGCGVQNGWPIARYGNAGRALKAGTTAWDAYEGGLRTRFFEAFVEMFETVYVNRISFEPGAGADSDVEVYLYSLYVADLSRYEWAPPLP